MGIKIKKAGDRKKQRSEQQTDEDYLEVGHGDYSVVTVNRHNGSVVVHRFQTADEAMKQYARNVVHDLPLVGIGKPN